MAEKQVLRVEIRWVSDDVVSTTGSIFTSIEELKRRVDMQQGQSTRELLHPQLD